MKKRLLSSFLVLAMVLTMLPATAFATELSQVNDIQVVDGVIEGGITEDDTEVEDTDEVEEINKVEEIDEDDSYTVDDDTTPDGTMFLVDQAADAMPSMTNWSMGGFLWLPR